MNDRFENVSAAMESYKCFRERAGYDRFCSVNLLVGRNNSGKSALLDLIEILCKGELPSDSGVTHKSVPSRFLITEPVTTDAVQRVFPSNVSEGPIRGNHFDYGKRFIGAKLTRQMVAQNYSFVSIEPPFAGLDAAAATDFGQGLTNSSSSTFRSVEFLRLRADRDIRPEPTAAELRISSDGSGFTNVVQNFITKAALPSDVIEKDLLASLNSIFEPDAVFSQIAIQQHGDGSWEVFLDEAEKGRVSLSNSGSGLKTVLLVLGFLHLLPRIKKNPASKFLFAFEELENNLHPALQRRLFKYIRDYTVSQKTSVFLTSHSPTAIDLLSNDGHAQIIHIAADHGASVAKVVTTYVENCGVLDDLDVRASDLLQANGIVWVEGPSDRIYVNRWIYLFSAGSLVEGVHYQCVFYGGRLLARLSAAAPTSEDRAAVQLLRINRNALMIIDSDRRAASEAINDTKTRVSEELSAINGACWITAGREVENYLPTSALTVLYPSLKGSLGQYDDLAALLDTVADGEGSRFLRDKVGFADRILPYLTPEALASVLDLKTQVLSAVKMIARWNRLPQPESA